MILNETVPYHLQIKDILEQEILKGKYKEKIPSEMELMERFDVSRSTVRQAVSHLVDEGLLKKKHGKGTFVSFRPVMDWLGSFKTYEEIIVDMGMKPYIMPVKSGIVKLDEEVSKVMDSEEAFLIKRIRYADDVPISIEENYYPVALGEKFKNISWENVASYTVLQSIGVILWDATQMITGRMPTVVEKDMLNLENDIPVLFIERLNFDNERQIVEYERSVYRADMYSFVVNFGRKNLIQGNKING